MNIQDAGSQEQSRRRDENEIQHEDQSFPIRWQALTVPKRPSQWAGLMGQGEVFSMRQKA